MSMRFTEIGQQLRAYRLESGLRAEEIAARLGVSRAALYRYEKGEVIKLDTIKRLAELLKISPLSLLGIGVEYYNRPIGYFERIRQVEETADQILQLFGPICYLTTSDAYDNALAEAFDEAAEQAAGDRVAMRSMAEQVLGHPERRASGCMRCGGQGSSPWCRSLRFSACWIPAWPAASRFPTGCGGSAAMSRSPRWRTWPR